jgi:hypothetical protein
MYLRKCIREKFLEDPSLFQSVLLNDGDGYREVDASPGAAPYPTQEAYVDSILMRTHSASAAEVTALVRLDAFKTSGLELWVVHSDKWCTAYRFKKGEVATEMFKYRSIRKSKDLIMRLKTAVLLRYVEPKQPNVGDSNDGHYEPIFHPCSPARVDYIETAVAIMPPSTLDGQGALETPAEAVRRSKRLRAQQTGTSEVDAPAPKRRNISSEEM